MKRPLALVVLLVALGACSSAPEAATVTDVVAGRQTDDPTSFAEDLPKDAIVVTATVTDVRREAEGPLVELGDGDETIWVSGFTDPPARGAEVLTAVLGAPQPDERVGLLYTTVGALDPENIREGWSERGALGVGVGATAALVVLSTLVVAFVGRVRARGRCTGCGAVTRPDWITCPSCSKRLAAEPPIPPPAVSSQPPGQAPGATIMKSAVPAAEAPTSSATRIVRD